jgi:hypothetical protein
MNERFIKNKNNKNKLQGRRIMPKNKDEFECLLSMPNLGKYVGKWIAVVDDKIVSIGTAGREVLSEARSKYPDRTPLILKVPSQTVMLL